MKMEEVKAGMEDRIVAIKDDLATLVPQIHRLHAERDELQEELARLERARDVLDGKIENVVMPAPFLSGLQEVYKSTPGAGIPYDLGNGDSLVIEPGFELKIDAQGKANLIPVSGQTQSEGGSALPAAPEFGDNPLEQY